MNSDHHSLNTAAGQPPGNTEPPDHRSHQTHGDPLTPTTSATDLRVNSAAVNVALSSVAKYWVFTNLFPGPITPVSVYGLPPGGRAENGKAPQDPLATGQQSQNLLNGDPNIILGHHSSQSSSLSSSSQQLPGPQIGSSQGSLVPSHQELAVQSSSSLQSSSVATSQASHHQVENTRVEFVQHHNIDMGHHSQQQNMMQQQLMSSSRQDHTSTNQIQLTVSEDGIVTVVEPGGGKDKDDHIKLPQDHALTVHQLQQIVGQQVLDSVVRIEQATGEPANILVTHNPDGTTSIEASASHSIDPLHVKEEKCNKIDNGQYGLPTEIKDLKGAIDLKSVGGLGVEGAVVKISAGTAEHDLHAMYKVNVEDLSQLLAYHEVFGKLSNEAQGHVAKAADVDAEAGPSAILPDAGETSPGLGPAGDLPCDICGKTFQFKYQLIVHRRYHSERKFSCLQCGQAFPNAVELSKHGKCLINEILPAKRPVQDKPYVCTTCHKTFARKEHLDNHVRSHTGETPYRCQYCAKTFTRKEHMVNHIRKHTGETPHRCDICKKSFTRKEHFMNHVMWHTGETPHQCQICGKKYTRKEHLVNHMRSHTNDTPFRCELCGKSFTRKEHYTNHIMWHTGETPHRCDFCSKTFTRKEHLLNHVRQHTGESPHRCNYCSKSFTRREHLVNHVRQHTGETPFQCGYCPKAFTRKDHLVNHVRQHTGESPHKCSYCPKSFTRKEHLTNHVRQHTGESPHRCHFCSKSFTRKEHLTNHIRQHTGETPHKCMYCEKAFQRKEHLTTHIRLHTGDNPHTCTYCNKSFSRKEHLVNHTRQHTGETPFKCEFCTKAFGRKEHLTNHMHVHTGENPHSCTYCTKSFTRKEHLTNHIRIHTGESPHRCDFCQKTYTRKEHLTNHLKQHTGDTPHSCKICNKPFTRREHLVTHMKLHSVEKPHTCGECGKSFPLKGNLLFHERSHNKGPNADRPFKCDLCTKDFICKGHLTSHRRAHPEATPPKVENTEAGAVAGAAPEQGTAAGAEHACAPCGKSFADTATLQRHQKKVHERAPSQIEEVKPQVQLPHPNNSQNSPNAVMPISSGVRPANITSSSPGNVATNPFGLAPLANQRPPPSALQHHPLTVNY